MPTELTMNGRSPALPGGTTVPHLQRRHFAFMRAVLQGLDEKDSWNRYLREDGEPADARTIRQTVGWIRDAFATAAKREDRPGTARLVRLDPDKFRSADPLPTLEEFAAMRGMEDFSEAEQAEAYEDAYPATVRGTGGRGRGRPEQRGRLVARQLEALRWLEHHVAPEPRPVDSVSAWLNPAIAERLEQAGIATLSDLVSQINRDGARWWRRVPGVGSVKAARVVAWLKTQDASSALVPAPHALYPHASIPAALLEQVVEPGTALVPLEKLLIPHALDGSNGSFRAVTSGTPPRWGRDRDAVLAWLQAKCTEWSSGAAPATARRYRKEAERLLLWSVLERRRAVSSLTPQDAAAYLQFLSEPPPHWCGPRHHERWSTQWRPLEGPMAPASVDQARVLLRSLFSWLVRQGYLKANAFDGLSARPPRERQAPQSPIRQLDAWRELEGLLESESGPTTMRHRVLRCLRWTRLTGLPLEQLAPQRCGDLQAMPSAVASSPTWILHLRSVHRTRSGRPPKGVPIPAELVRELNEELARNERPPDVGALENAQVGLLGPFDPSACARPWTAAAMAKAIQHACAQAVALELSTTGASPTPGIRHLRRISGPARVLADKGADRASPGEGSGVGVRGSSSR